ncbi:hypothetical protein KPH14_012295 [Odynerus spinipes]|uniref:CCHC-type domain-containing protein n=1 Tax=Odynerus spinipes TaxID=1348599 RepID=A0AAD9RHR0_9HYME|nr:hypothetical protein KPH14_012295 [Odynerus spinipes]
MGDREAIEWIVDGLNNPRYRDFLGPLSRYKRPSELLADLRYSNLNFKEIPAVAERRQVNRPAQFSAQLTCYACKQPGHTARTCPRARPLPSCYKCGQSGHMSRACPENIWRKQQGALERPTTTTTTARGETANV